jgi:hypothetical protein
LSKTVRTAPLMKGDKKMAFGESTVMEKRIVRLRTHQKNIDR